MRSPSWPAPRSTPSATITGSGCWTSPSADTTGYKQYGVRELLRLLRIRRLTGLGVPLSQIRDVSASGDSTPLRQVDADLARQIEDLQRARADIAAIIREDAPADVPSGFESVASHLSEADSSIIHIYSQLYDDSAMADLRHMVETGADDGVGAELNALPPDADEETKRQLIDRLAPTLAQNLIEHPWLKDPVSHLSRLPGQEAPHESIADRSPDSGRGSAAAVSAELRTPVRHGVDRR